MKIAVLGAGNMGLSFSKSFLKYELIKPKNLHLITRSQNKKEKIKSVFSESEISSFEEVKNLEADLIIIAVKPQDFAFVAKNLTFKIPEKSLVLSIMAGISIEKIHFFYYTGLQKEVPASRARGWVQVPCILIQYHILMNE